MKWTKYCKLVLIIGSWRKNMDYSSSILGCARRNYSKYLALGVLSAWWKTSASEGVLFQTVLPQRRARAEGSGRSRNEAHTKLELEVN